MAEANIGSLSVAEVGTPEVSGSRIMIASRSAGMARATFKVTGIELLEYPAESGHVKLTVVFQSNGGQNGGKESRMFGATTPEATHTLHIHNPDPDELKAFIDALYTKKSFYADLTETP
jgi:hypothetical protein